MRTDSEYKEAMKEAEAELTSPPSKCECLNPGFIYQIREGLKELSDGYLAELKRMDKRIGKLTGEEKQGVIFGRQLIEEEMDATEVALGMINKMPSCKKES